MQKAPLMPTNLRIRPKKWRWLAVLGFLGAIYIAGHLPFHTVRDLPHWIQRQLSSKTSARRALTASSPKSSWANPLTGPSRVIQSFGWHREQGSMVFSPGIQLHVPYPENVMTPVPGQVSRVSRHMVSVKSSTIQVEFQGLSKFSVHSGQKLIRHQILGHTSRHLTIIVLRGNLPVNPLAPQYFGSGGLH